MRATRGFTLVEAVVVIGILGALAAIALPSLAKACARAEVTAAREAFASAHAMARQVAAQYGRPCKLHLDPDGNRFWVTADTSSMPGVEVLDTIQPMVLVADRFAGVQIDSKPRTLCFDSRGLTTARGACGLPNITVVFRRGSVADTVVISRLGRLRRR